MTNSATETTETETTETVTTETVTTPETSTAHSSPTLERPRRSRLRRLGLGLGALLLLALVVSLVMHLTGRSKYAASVAAFQEVLGDVVPDPRPAALMAQIASYAPEPVADVDNAARYLVAGAEAVVWGEGEYDVVRELAAMPVADWAVEQRQILTRVLDRNRGALDTMSSAVPLPDHDFGLDYDDIMNVEVPDLLGQLRAGVLLSLEGRLALTEGDLDLGFEALDNLDRMSRALREEEVLIFSLVAHVTERMALHAIVEILESDEAWARDPEVLARAESWLLDDDLATYTREVVALDSAVLSYSMLLGHPEEFLERPALSKLSRYLVGHRYAGHFLDQGRQTAVLVEKPFGTHREIYDAPAPEGVSGMILGNYRNAVAKAQAALSQRQLVRNAIALRRAGLDRGSYLGACAGVTGQPDPFLGEPPTCEIDADGSLRLELVGAREMIEEISPGPRTSWITAARLPAPLIPEEPSAGEAP